MAGFRKVVAGQPYDGFPAPVYNAIIDVITAYQRGELHHRNRDTDTFTSSGIVSVINSTGGGLDRFNIVGMSEPVILPTADEQEWANKVRMRGVIPNTTHREKFAVLQQPLNENEIGYAITAGVTNCRINMLHTDHQFADVKDGDTYSFESTSDGVNRILWVESGTGMKRALVRIVRPMPIAIVRIEGETCAHSARNTNCIWSGRSQTVATDGVSMCMPFSESLPCWIIAADSCASSGGEPKTLRLKSGEYYIGILSCEREEAGEVRPLYVIQPDRGWTRVNREDGLGFLEDQFDDWEVDYEPVTGDLIVGSTTISDEEDERLKQFVKVPGHELSTIQFIGHAMGEDGPSWESPQSIDVVTDIRLTGGYIEKRVMRVLALGGEDLGWQQAIPTTEC